MTVCWRKYLAPKMSEIVPLSYDAFVAQYGEGVEAFTTYCLGYWLQQNRAETPERIKLQAKYEERHENDNQL